MALEIESLSELSPEQVERMFQTLTQLMQERHQEVELTRGVFHDLVLYFNSALNAAIQTNIDRIMQSNSLLRITENPALADPALVDAVLSNFNIKRADGLAASGEATVIFLQPVTTTIPASLRISANGVIFYPAETFTALPPGVTPTASADRQMIEVGDGTYATNIAVVAETIGSAGNITKGTALEPDFAPNNAVKIYAAADFVNGIDPPTNEEYIAKLPDALAAKTIGGRASFAATIRKQSGFESVKHISVVGFGDAEQHRDQHSLFPISGGGRVDLYLQTYAEYQRQEHNLKATYIGPATTGVGTVWQIAIDKDVAPGFYEIVRVAGIKDTGASGYEIILQTRGFDFDDQEFVPDIITRAEGAYSRYQTAVIRFVDPITQPGSLIPAQSTANYAVTLAVMPLIGQIQDFLSSREIRSRATDVLVRAAVPCFTTISCTIRKDAASLQPDIAAMKKAVVAAIANVGFTGQLHASVITNALYPFLKGKQAVGSVEMLGRILRPDDTVAYLRDHTILKIPDDASRMVTGKTTAFLTREEDIAISVALAGYTS